MSRWLDEARSTDSGDSSYPEDFSICEYKQLLELIVAHAQFYCLFKRYLSWNFS